MADDRERPAPWGKVPKLVQDVAPEPQEFDCAECGRGVVAYAAPPGTRLCAICLALPWWFEDPRLRCAFEPDDAWVPPVVDHDDPATWRCAAPFCDRRDALLRISGYDEPFRGLCPDHIDGETFWRLHRARNGGD